jgi:serine protease AprX
MRIKLIIFSLFFLSVTQAQRQVLVYFKDKGPNAEAALKHPDNFLSQQAIERRLLCNSNFDLLDVPVNPGYTAILQAHGYAVISSSKWLNADLVSTSNEYIPAILHLPMVEKIEVWDTYPVSNNNITGTTSIYDYGSASTQITMLNLDKLHDQGFTGNNILMAVCDGGFNSVNTLNAFQYMRSHNRIKAIRDFVTEDGDVYLDDAHGEEVLSVIAGKQDGAIIGSGFDADFLLARTENVNSETHAEEYNWMRAAEWADSIGAKIIQSSLGYNNFDSGVNYGPADMDGKTAIITKAAVVAMRKGIVVVNSAGNEGDKSFRKITAPSDADSILCVGSVDYAGGRVMNSGQGPSADGRIKPDVMAMGGNTAYYTVGNTVALGTGTSFASPLIAGLCACLMQKNKYITNIELVDAVKRSADRYFNPDTLYGYGIPNAVTADTILQRVAAGRGIFIANKNYESIIRNTLAHDGIVLNLEINKITVAEIYNASAACIFKKAIDSNKINISELTPGIYYLKLNGSFAGRFMKQ